MIASLRGQLIHKGKDFLIVDVGGVGFKVMVPQRLIKEWEATGQDVQLRTHLYVRENEIALYGCETEEEMELFRLLLTVSGVGPKAALSILSEYAPATLRQIVAQEDVDALARIPGIGPKTSRKIVLELKDKVSREDFLVAVSPNRTADVDLMAALTSLGYSIAEARAAIASVPPEKKEFEERLRLALRYFAR